MLIIGLIGRIGAGKSTVARRLAEHGATVIDADRIARDVLDEPAARKEVAARFGPAVLDADGTIRRAVLAERVFGPTVEHAAGLEALEAIIHPRVRRRMQALLDEEHRRELERGSRAVVVLDVPLLVQAGWAEACDRLIMVECADPIRRQRLAARNLTPAQQEAREAAWSRRYRAEHVPSRKTDTVDASADLAYTFCQVDRIWNDLQSDGLSG